MDLEILIQEIDVIKNNIVKVRPTPGSGTFFLTYNTLKDKDFYYDWKNRTERFLLLKYTEDICNLKFTNATSEFEKKWDNSYLSEIKGILNGLKKFPERIKNTNTNKNTNQNSITINNTNSQSQEQFQNQNIVLEIFLEAIKDELNGRQRKELLEIAKKEQDPEKAKSKILEKVESFGLNVSAGILTNIITNPNIWSSLPLLS